MKLHLDFETRSKCDLKMAGAYVYARDPSTRVLCAAYSFGDEEDVCYWPTAAAKPVPADLEKALADRHVEIHAWNAAFERNILEHVLGLDIDPRRFHCTAAHARARNLPGKLESALEFLGLGVSLAAKRYGTQIMMKWCKPLPTGGWANDAAEYMDLIRYCMDDVRSEMAVPSIFYDLR